MRSKTSFFNGTVFRKNLTRFAPLWLVYTLCLLLGMTLMYMEDGMDFWFANRMGELIQYSGIINLIYAPLAAILLFGDLYTGRMCNALHAMPLTRGCIYRTNVVSGLVFSLLPTAVFCGLSVPLLMNTCVVNGWQIALWTFLGMNLTYICFFGIAVFSALCVGTRFGMVAIYALFNGGAYVAYFLINTIYTPMLYGVVTPSALAENLTPIFNLVEAACLELDNYNDVFRGSVEDMVANYHLYPDGWLTVGIWAAVGAVMLLLARWLYSKRKLECAGDTMAFRAMEPVFQICISLCTAAFFSIFIDLFIGYHFRDKWQYLFLVSGLVVGWFAGRILLERTVRVFRFKNWLGLAAMAAVLAGSLAMTHYDVFGIETWIPAVEDVKSVTLGYNMYNGMSEELTEDADIEAVIRLQQLALEDRLEEGGSHLVIDGQIYSWTEMETLGLKDSGDYRYSSEIYIDYKMENGRTISRKYIVWGDAEEAEIVNEYLSRWEVVSRECYYTEKMITNLVGEGEVPAYTTINVAGYEAPMEYRGQRQVASLLEAMQADCEERTMTQRTAFHTGHFEFENDQGIMVETRSFWIELAHDDGRYGNFYVYADSENTLKWLEERDLLPYEVCPDNGYVG